MGRRKRTRRHREDERARGRRTRASVPIVELLAGATEAIEAALSALTRPCPTVGVESVGESYGPLLPGGPGGATVDSVLRDRYEGLLVRSGVVAGSVHNLPSRLRERLEDAIREVIAGVVRDDTIEAHRVESMVADIMMGMGQQVVMGVERWRREQSMGVRGSAAPADEPGDGTEDATRHP